MAISAKVSFRPRIIVGSSLVKYWFSKAFAIVTMARQMKAKRVLSIVKDRGPSAKLAAQRVKDKNAKGKNRSIAMSVEAQSRKSGGYGIKTVSIHAAPKGGIKNSPAYRAVLVRCGVKGSVLPPPEKRDGAFVKGGFPYNKYPVNVIVDGSRFSWVPDDWAQVVKNTGPGGIYIGWMSPEGKFFYHRHGYTSAMQEVLGKELGPVDGWNGTLRNVGKRVSTAADKTFLRETLSGTERKHLLPKEKFHFAVVSAFRADIESGIESCLLVEAQFRLAGVKPTWYVDAGGVGKYKALGLDAVAGGKLTPARNMALDVAKKKGLVCVQVSDDISKWEFIDCAKQSFKCTEGFTAINNALLGAKTHTISPVAAAQFMLAKMRSHASKPMVAGVFPTANAALTLGQAEYNMEHFILGDFFVAEPSSPCRFDTTMTLKEDYDYTCSHIKTHGCVLRCNRMLVHARHATNDGGAVAARDSAGKKENANIEILQKKWPGVFIRNKKRQNEVLMRWSQYGQEAKNTSKAVKGKFAAKVGMKMAEQIAPVKKTHVKLSTDMTLNLNASVKYTETECKTAYLSRRCKRLNGKTVRDCLGMMYTDGSGNARKYGISDLRYDVAAGRLKVAKAGK